MMPTSWSSRGEGRSLAPGRRDRGADYLFSNPHNERTISHDEAWDLVRAPRPRLPNGHPVGWDYGAIDFFVRELTERLVWVRGCTIKSSGGVTNFR